MFCDNFPCPTINLSCNIWTVDISGNLLRPSVDLARLQGAHWWLFSMLFDPGHRLVVGWRCTGLRWFGQASASWVVHGVGDRPVQGGERCGQPLLRPSWRGRTTWAGLDASSPWLVPLLVGSGRRCWGRGLAGWVPGSSAACASPWHAALVRGWRLPASTRTRRVPRGAQPTCR